MAVRVNKHVVVPNVLKAGLIGGGMGGVSQLCMIGICACLMDKGVLALSMLPVAAAMIQLLSCFAGTVISCMITKEKKLQATVVTAGTTLLLLMSVMILGYEGSVYGVGKGLVCCLIGCITGLLICMIPKKKKPRVKVRYR